MRCWLIAALTAALGFAQTFDVASVKPAGAGQDGAARVTKRGPGSKDPGRVHYADKGVDRYRIVGQQQTMQALADRLTLEFDRVVKDETSLTSEYDFILTFSPESTAPEAAPFPDIFAAIQSQLGLKLEAKKGPVATIVIDHAEKTPTAN